MDIDARNLSPEHLRFEQLYFLLSRPPGKDVKAMPSDAISHATEQAIKGAVDTAKRLLLGTNAEGESTVLSRILDELGVEDSVSEKQRRIEDSWAAVHDQFRRSARGSNAETLRFVARVVREYAYAEAWLVALRELSHGGPTEQEDGSVMNRVATIRALIDGDGLASLSGRVERGSHAAQER